MVEEGQARKKLGKGYAWSLCKDPEELERLAPPFTTAWVRCRAELGVGMDTEAALQRHSKQWHVLPRLPVKEPEFLLAAYKKFVATDNDPLLEHVAAVIEAVRVARASW